MSDFQRLLQLTDALQRQRKEGPAESVSFAEDTDIQAKALAVFEAQGVTITPKELRAAVTELDQAQERAWQQAPIVPLAVQCRAPRRWWRSRDQRQSDKLRWIHAFQTVRRERYDVWFDRSRSGSQHMPNSTPLSDAHQALLEGAYPAIRKAEVGIPFVAGMPGPVGAQWDFESPLNHCLLDQFRGNLKAVDLVLAQWLLDQDATLLQVRQTRNDWGDLNAKMGTQKTASLLELLLRGGHVDLLAQLRYAWPVPRTWIQSLLWWVLVLPLMDQRKADHERSQGAVACLETTVRFILAHEPNATRHHARVIHEALALHHPHSDWLRQWLATPQEALA